MKNDKKIPDLKLKYKENDSEIKLLKYQTSFINQVSSTAQATRAKVIGQTSNLTREFIRKKIMLQQQINMEEWGKFYINKQPESIKKAIEKIKKALPLQLENINKITDQDIKNWVEDLVYKKTFVGHYIEYQIFNLLKDKYSKADWERSTKEDESKGIDIKYNSQLIQIKPNTHFSNTSIYNIYEKMKSDNIDIIFYKINKKKNDVEVFISDSLKIKLNVFK